MTRRVDNERTQSYVCKTCLADIPLELLHSEGAYCNHYTCPTCWKIEDAIQMLWGKCPTCRAWRRDCICIFRVPYLEDD